MNDVALGIVDMIKIDEDFWGIASNYNGLFRWKENAEEAIKVMEFSNLQDDNWLYKNLIFHEGKIICIPYNAKNIIIYDIKSKHKVTIPICEPCIKTTRYGGKGLFIDAVSYKQYVLLISAMYPAILKINMKTYEVQYFDDWVKQMEENAEYQNGAYFRKSHVIIENQLYLSCYVSPYIIQIDMDTFNFKYHLVMEGRHKAFVGIKKCGNKLWIAPTLCKSLIEWDLHSGLFKEYYLTNTHTAQKVPTLCSIEALDDKLYVFSQVDNEIFEYDVKMHKNRKLLNHQNKEINNCRGYDRYFFTKKLGSVIYAYSRAYEIVLKIDNDNIRNCRNVTLDEDSRRKFWKNQIKNNFAREKLCNENEFFSLLDFLDFLQQRNKGQ